MRIAVFSDVHGNAVALQAVLAAARELGPDAYWVIGDLVANGPQPVTVLKLLRWLPNLRAVRGNTDRYVLTGDLRGMIPPIDDPTTAQEIEVLVEASSAHAWTRGCITAAGSYDWLADLPLEQRCQLPDRTRVLLVHASPGRDDGPGLTPVASDREAAGQGWADCGADLVFTGHTHVPFERTIGGVRVINVGSVSVPPEPRGATWTMVEADKNGYSVQRHVTDYDLGAVSDALEVSHHPSAHWLTKKLHLTNASPAPLCSGSRWSAGRRATCC